MPYKPDVYHRLQKIHIQIKIEKKKSILSNGSISTPI